MKNTRTSSLGLSTLDQTSETLDMSLGRGVGDLGFPSPEEQANLLISFGPDPSEGLDLTNFLSEPEPTSKLDWLDYSVLPETEEFLPNQVDPIGDLEEAWSVDRSGSNLHAVTAVDLQEAQYRDALSEDAQPVFKLDRGAIQQIVASVMRRSAAGMDVDTAIKAALESCGEEMDRVAPALMAVRAEHGLAGNVYIRASAYPNYGSGKWKKLLQKSAGAKYLIVSKAELDGAAWIKNGYCSITGKRAVLSVPWKQALDYYTPRLTALGKRVASEAKNPVESLRLAFLSTSKTAAPVTYFPTSQAPADRISSQAARKVLAEQSRVRESLDPTAARVARQMPRVKQRLSALLAAQMLTAAQCEEILASGQEPVDMLKRAGQLVTTASRATRGFNGQANSAGRAAAEFGSLKIQAEQELLIKGQQKLLAAEAEKQTALRVAEAVKKVKKLTAKGMRGASLASEIRRSISAADLRLSFSEISKHLAASGALKEATVSEYQGSQFTPVENRVSSVQEIKKVSPVVVWARQAMSEGYAGNELSAMLESRFLSAARLEAEPQLKAARAQHEGGAGFLYVDAEAYATSVGVKGCEKGALKHASNLIPAVAAMPRCGSCTHVTALADGTRRCALYNKVLLSSRDLSSEKLATKRLANIRSADAPDYENTSNLFAKPYNPDEFGLQESTIDSLGLTDPEKLVDVFFGGWDISRD